MVYKGIAYIGNLIKDTISAGRYEILLLLLAMVVASVMLSVCKSRYKRISAGILFVLSFIGAVYLLG